MNNDLKIEDLKMKKSKKKLNRKFIPLISLVVLFFILLIALIIVINIDVNNDDKKVQSSLNIEDVKLELPDGSCNGKLNDYVDEAKDIKITFAESDNEIFVGEEEYDEKEERYFICTKKECPDKYVKSIDMYISKISKNLRVEMLIDDPGVIEPEKLEVDKGVAKVQYLGQDTSGIVVYVYANVKGCDVLVRQINVVTPKVNALANDKNCESEKYKDSKYCQKYVYNDVDEKGFEKLGVKIKNTKVIIAIIVASIFVVLVAGFVAYRKMRV